MVIFAREDALEVSAEFPAHCLDVAVAALLDEMRHRGIAFTVADFMGPEQPAEAEPYELNGRCGGEGGRRIPWVRRPPPPFLIRATMCGWSAALRPLEHIPRG